MARELDRRAALRWLGGLGLGAAFASSASSARASRARPPARARVEELAERLASTSRERAFDLAADAIRAGASATELLAAIFVCGAREIRPRPHGILHSVMMVESAFRLHERAAPREAWLPVLWNLDDLQVSLAEDRSDWDDWRLPAARAERAPSRERARAELASAMEGDDPERADRALVALLPHEDAASFFELYRPIALRCYAYIGHKLIYAAQAERVLERIGWEHAEPALRSLVRSALVDRDVASFERACELAPRFPERWRAGRTDPDASEALARELGAVDAERARSLVLCALEDGLGPASAWDALRVRAAELFQRRTGRGASAGRSALLPVHAVTVTNACAYVARASASEATQRLALLQGAAWLASLRDDLDRMVGLSLDGPAFAEDDGAAGAPADELARALERASPARVRRALEARPDAVPAALAALESSLLKTGREHHQHKYAAALDEDARAVDPRFAARLIAPAVDYLADPADGESEVHARSLAALRRAGVL